ncbi:choline/ethanolamine kinase family protein [Bacillus sp. FJAT-50079]|uniref:choline/ethanolamine kinase family protein n=1 Tax=Bacillus sp. FJAT-50079 TaxID=2833577 RepID=UPI001BC92396|nr:choline/ethanolamine kinase family protein [Bacillus sp. FJAT-50079]MBS4208220.1 phosphotransferase family protein [Bacillus sp. FJAT-50079]
MAFYQEVKQLISDALHAPLCSITNIQQVGGMTNLNFRVTIQDKEFVVRIPGKGTVGMINRVNEFENAMIGYEIGINVKQEYFNKETGLKITAYIDDAESLTRQSARQHENIKQVADILRKLHYSGRVMNNAFDVFAEIELYEHLINQKGGTYLEGYEAARHELFLLKDYYESIPIELAPCHIDPVAGNLIKTRSGTLYLIDWEYSGMCDPLWDVGVFIEECGLSIEEADLFMTSYFQREPTLVERERILLNHIFQDFLWSLWSQVKKADGEDLGAYGDMRLNRAKNKMAQFFEMINGEDVG